MDGIERKQESDDMYKLTLPAFEPQLRKQEGKPFIFDVIRKKFVQLTPEEWVRQHFIHFLAAAAYPLSLISVERGHKYNGQMAKRTDIIVYDRQLSPFLLVECKAPYITPDQKLLDQALMYNHTVKAQYVALTNGLHHFYYRADFAGGTYHRLETLPEFGV